MVICGNLVQKQRLLDSLDLKSQIRFTILCGPSFLGKRTFALEALGGLINPIDLMICESGIDEVREASSFCSQSPSLSPYRAVVMDCSSMPSHGAQSAMLKLCEDPSFSSRLFMILNDDGSLLPSLLSRINLRLPWSPLSNEEMVEFGGSIPTFDLKLLDAVQGRPGLYEAARSAYLDLHNVTVKIMSHSSRISSFGLPEALKDVKASSLPERELISLSIRRAVRTALQDGIKPSRTVSFLKFAALVTKTTSASVEMHWRRACMDSPAVI